MKKIFFVFLLLFAFFLSADNTIYAADYNTCPSGLRSLNLTPIAVICGAAIDAINPCEFAILILLMASLLFNGGDRRQALLTGLSFTAAIFIAYLLMGIGLLEFLRTYTLAYSRYFYDIIGGLAIILGLFNIKDYFWYGGGFLMEVPRRWRPTMKELIKKISGPGGGFVIGFVVSLFLLPCTSGPYIIILGLLASQTDWLKAITYLITYNLIFIAPMLTIIAALYFGLSPEKSEEWRKSKLRLMHLIAGVTLIALGIAILGRWI